MRFFNRTCEFEKIQLAQKPRHTWWRKDHGPDPDTVEGSWHSRCPSTSASNAGSQLRKLDTGFPLAPVEQLCCTSHPCLQRFVGLDLKLKTSPNISPMTSVFSFWGNRLSRSCRRTWSPPIFWYSSVFRCSTRSKAFPDNKVYMYGQ